MPTISFKKPRPSIVVETGSVLMDVLNQNGVPVASSCGGEGVCIKCVITVVDGLENLSRPNELEKDLRDIHDLPRNQRISCQTEILGDIVIDTPYW
jgi:2Fe-2S ferredoxin